MTDDEYPIVDAGDGDRPDAADTLGDGTYVRFCEGLAVLVEANRVVMTGGLRRQMFTGRDACRVAAELVPLLDGRRTAAEACAASGMKQEAAKQAISIFRSLGLVEYADRPFRHDDRLTSHASAFLSRSAHAAGTYRNSQDSGDALATSAVLVLARAPIAKPLQADLLACGIGSVVLGNAADVAATEAAVAAIARWPHHLVIGVEDLPARAALTVTETACRDRAVPLLRAARVATTAELGPLFLGGHTACYACFNRDHADYFADRAGEPTLDDADPCPLDEVLAAMIAEEALAVLGHIRNPQSYRSVTFTSLSDYSDQRLTVLPWPDCTVCGALSPREDEADVAGVYEWEVQGAPASLIPPGGQAGLARPDLKELATRRPLFPSSPSYPLAAEAEAEACAATSTDGRRELTSLVPLGSAQLARILARVGGRHAPGHPSDLRRWAPSGGNLASVGLYAITAGSGFGATAERLTVYDDIEHRLIVARAGRVCISKVLAETGLEPTEPTAVIVFVAHVARIARKYTGFGYRLAHLDAGVAAVQLLAVAQELDLGVAFAPTWSADLAELLELLPEQEYITAVAVLSPQERRADAADS
jgi:SagB-type dehydrogenase family enzyme